MVGLQQSMWMKEHDDIIMRFVKDEDPNNRLLTFHIDSQEKLIVSRDIPPYFVDQLFYMIKKKPVKVEVTNSASNDNRFWAKVFSKQLMARQYLLKS